MHIALSSAGPLDGQIGGGQIYVQNLAHALAARGHRITLIAPSEDAEGLAPWSIHRSTWQGLQLISVAMPSPATGLGGAWSATSPPLLAATRQAIQSIDADVLHLNGMKPAMTAVASELKMPHVVTAHHGGIVCISGALLRPDDSLCELPMAPANCVRCFCSQLKRGSKAGKMLGSVPSWAYRPIGRTLSVLPTTPRAARIAMYPWLVERWIENKQSVMDNAQLFIAPSSAIAEALQRNGAPPQRIVRIPHGIAPLPHMPLRPIGGRRIRFGYIGQINRPKGLHVLLKAYSQLPPNLCELHIIGSPQQRGEREYLDNAMAPCAGRTDVFLKGAVPHSQIANVVADFDVLVLPSIYLEVFGLVILEALSVGRPVIVSDCGGPAEIIRNRIDGLIVRRNDAGDLARAMRELAEDPRQLEALVAGITPVRTLDQHVNDLELVYQRAIDDVHGASAMHAAAL